MTKKPESDKSRARRLLNEIVESDMYPAAQRIAAAKALMEDDGSTKEGQELLAMELTDEQLVDIIARAQQAEKTADQAAKVDCDPGNHGQTDAEHAPVSTKSTANPAPIVAPIVPRGTSLAERLAGIGNFEDDPLCQ